MRAAPLTVGSLFSGIGGLELGLEAAGMEVKWQVEKDQYCRRVLAKHWPTVTRHEDVHDVGSRNLERVDLICGGFPCQDVSHAGKRLGILRGKRSGLWVEFARIIRELRPRFVLVENVSALLVPDRGFDIVLGDLAEIGYDAVWDCIPASYVGAPHRRDRVWVVGYARGESFHWLHNYRSSDARSGEAGQESVDANDSDRGAVENATREHLEKRVDDGGADERRAYGEPAGSGEGVADADGVTADDAGSGAGEVRGRRPKASALLESLVSDPDGEPSEFERIAAVFYRACGILEAIEGIPQPHAALSAGADVADPGGGGLPRGESSVRARESDARGGCAAIDVADALSSGLEGYPGHGGDGGGREESAGSVGAGGIPRGAEVADASSDGRGESAERSPRQQRLAQRFRGSRGEYAGRSNWQIEPDVGRVVDGVPARVDRLRGLGNAVVPQNAEWIGCRINEAINV